MKEAYAVRRTVPPSAEIEEQIDRLLAVGVGENPRESLSELAKLGARLIIQRAVEDEFDALDERRAEEARPIPAARPQRLKEAKRRLDEERWTECRANAAYEAYRAGGRMKDGRRFGRPPDPYQPPAMPAGVINLTDPDSRNVKTSRGWVQGYNAQAVVTAGQIVIAADVTVDSPDFGHLEPMITAAQAESPTSESPRSRTSCWPTPAT